MCVAEAVHEGPATAADRQVLWCVRVLLAAALTRALRAGLDETEIRELLDELIEREGVKHA